MFRFLLPHIQPIASKVRRAIQEIQYHRLRRQLTPEDITMLVLIARSIIRKA